MKIEGVPEGFELLRIGTPEEGELYMEGSGEIRTSPDGFMASGYAIFKKIEKPKRYRPFVCAKEFKPHRDRWTLRVNYDPRANNVYPPKRYSDEGYDGTSWLWCFENYKFDDGTPFGIEVTE